MNGRQDVVIIQLQQDRDRIEKENKQLKKDLEIYNKEIPKCVLDIYTVEERNGIYKFVDNKGKIIDICDIEDVIEKEVFKEASYKVSDYNICYNKILKNEKLIKDINHDIELRIKI